LKTFILTKGPLYRRRILLGVVVGVPVFFLRMVQDPFNVPKLVLLMIGVTLAGAIRLAELSQGAKAQAMKHMLVPAVAIGGPLLIAWVFSDYRDYALFGLYGRFQGLIPYLVVIAFGLLLVDAFAGRARDLAWGVLLAGGFVGGYGLVQIIGADPFTWAVGGEETNQALSSIGNPNFSGGLLGVFVPVGVAMYFDEKKRRTKVAIITLLMIGGCYVAFSQGGYAAAVAGSAVVLGFKLSERWRIAKILGALAALAVAVFLVGAVVFTIFADRFGPFEYTVASRGWWWEAAVGTWTESPVVGAGPNSFFVEANPHRPLADALYWNFNIADDPHSVLFAFLANAGALGVIGFLTVLGFAVREGCKLDRTNMVGVAFLGGVIAYFTQAFISIDEVSLRVALWTMLAGLVASLLPAPQEVRSRPKAARARRGRKRAPVREPVRRWPVLPLVGLAALAALWYGGGFLVADGRFHQGALLWQQERFPEARRQYELALSFRDDYEYRRRYARQLAQQVGQEGDVYGRYYERATELLSFLDDFPQVNTVVEQARLVRARAQVELELQDRALEIYARAFRIDPLNPIIRVEYAGLLLDKAREQEAADLMEAFADEMGRDQYPDFWGMLAWTRALVGDEAGAREAIDIALALNPDEPNAQQAQEVLEGSEAAS
jgi:tetratricopeptide (TPR) repeat protein